MSAPEQSEIEGSEFKSTVLRGSAWMLSSRLIQQALAIVKIFILARLLSQDEFGRFGVAMIAFSLVETLTLVGFYEVLIQKSGPIRDWLKTAFTLLVARGLVVYTALWFAAPYIADFFGDPDSTHLIRLMGLFIPITGFINPVIIEAYKYVDYKRLFAFQTSAVVVDFLVVCVLGFLYRDALAVVIGVLAGRIASLIVSYMMHSYRPSFGLLWEQVCFLFNRGKWFLTSNILTYVNNETGSIATGRFLGLTALGVYNVSLRISFMPVWHFGGVLGQVFFPAMAQIRDDKERLRSVYTRYLSVNCVVIFPIAGVLLFLTEDLVRVLIGERWLDAIPVLKAFALLVFVNGINNTSVALFHAVERTQVNAFIQGLRITVLLLLIYPSLTHFGVKGAPLAVLAGELIVLPYLLVKIRRYTFWKWTPLLLTILIPLAAALIPYGLAAYIGEAFLDGMNSTLRLFLLLATGSVSYLVLLFAAEKLFGIQTIGLLIDTAQSFLNKQSRLTSNTAE